MPFKKGNNYGYSGASPKRRSSPGRRRSWLSTVVYTITDGELTSNPVWQRRIAESQQSITINRYHYKALDELLNMSGYDDADLFWEDFKENLENICRKLGVIATNKLRELIATRAYTTVKSIESVGDDENKIAHVQFESAEAYVPTGEFVNAFTVIVSMTKSYRSLRIEIIYNHDHMRVQEPLYPHYYPIHQGFKGEDYRITMMNLLNEEWSFWRDNGETSNIVIRPGGWQEAFDAYCHTELRKKFLEECDKVNMLDV